MPATAKWEWQWSLLHASFYKSGRGENLHIHIFRYAAYGAVQRQCTGNPRKCGPVFPPSLLLSKVGSEVWTDTPASDPMLNSNVIIWFTAERESADFFFCILANPTNGKFSQLGSLDVVVAIHYTEGAYFADYRSIAHDIFFSRRSMTNLQGRLWLPKWPAIYLLLMAEVPEMPLYSDVKRCMLHRVWKFSWASGIPAIKIRPALCLR